MKVSIDALVDEAIRSCAPEELGMVLVHRGVVRGTSKDGRPVEGLHVEVDEERLRRIEAKYRGMDGIGYVKVIANSGFLKVGETIMTVVVAGRFRDCVIPAMSGIIEEVKAISRKKEVFSCP